MHMFSCSSGADETEDEEVPTREAWDTESLGLGALDGSSIQQVLGLARCLIRSAPEEAQLDVPAQSLIASMQVNIL